TLFHYCFPALQSQRRAPAKLPKGRFLCIQDTYQFVGLLTHQNKSLFLPGLFWFPPSDEYFLLLTLNTWLPGYIARRKFWSQSVSFLYQRLRDFYTNSVPLKIALPLVQGIVLNNPPGNSIQSSRNH